MSDPLYSIYELKVDKPLPVYQKPESTIFYSKDRDLENYMESCKDDAWVLNLLETGELEQW